MLLEYLSNTLLLEKSYIADIADTASQRYKLFHVKKKSGGQRTILHPARELKALQRVIHDDILNSLPLHESAFAYRKNISLLNHAKVHAGGSFVLRMDFSNFFESILRDDVVIFVEQNKSLMGDGWCSEDTELFTKLVCFGNSLTIGSVTSPSLSNVMCYGLDEKLKKLSYAHDVKYSRYADDLYFSTHRPNVLRKIQLEVVKIVRQISLPSNLSINTSKTHHTSRKKKMAVTGLTLTTDGSVSIGREMKRKLRAMIFSWEKLNGKEKKFLVGYLSFCSSVEPEFINSLCRKYGAELITKIQRSILK
ncbi:retron St85 family RNA-directed DNA polymerase [Shewanella waksmanii]|uniref:retron St85 family RNA-directed DNA polymerase n=1 Tax=Shewanella waksmanii TaxID=213783 RepID=UPI003736072B